MYVTQNELFPAGIMAQTINRIRRYGMISTRRRRGKSRGARIELMNALMRAPMARFTWRDVIKQSCVT